MTVTYSYASQSPASDSRVWRGRAVESGLLLSVLLVFLLGLVLVHLGVSGSFPQATADLESGELLNLSVLESPEQLIARLDFFEQPAEREFVGQELWGQAIVGADATLPNVGALAKVQIDSGRVRARPELEELNRRLDARPRPSVALLSSSQLQTLKSGLVVRTPGRFTGAIRLWALLQLLAFGGVHLFWRARRFRGDQMLLPCVALLSCLGLLLMIGLRDPLRDSMVFVRFAQGVVAGCLLLGCASSLEIERRPWFARQMFPPLLAALALSTLLILFGSGPGSSDAKVNLFGFQPVEAVKVLVVLFLSAYFSQRWEFLRELSERGSWLPPALRRLGVPKLRYALPPLLSVGLILVFFYLQKDLGPALVLALLFLTFWAVARGRVVALLAGASVLVGAFYLGFLAGVPRTVAARVAMWTSPWENRVAGGDHLAQTLWAFAAGGETGIGIGLGESGGIPAIHTDMVLAAIGEELGLAGVVTVCLLEALVVFRCFRIGQRSQTAYGAFLCLGCGLVLSLQFLLIAGGSLGLLPLSGVVTPFLSYGRTSLILNLGVIGLVLAVSSSAGSGGPAGVFRGAVRWLEIALAVALAVVVGRAVWVQGLAADELLAKPVLAVQGDGIVRYLHNPRLRAIARSIPRGTVFDRNGLPLATSDELEAEEARATLAGEGIDADAAGWRSDGRHYPLGGLTYHLLGDLGSRTDWAASNTSFVERDARARLRGFDDHRSVVRVAQRDGTLRPAVRLDYGELVPLWRVRHRPGQGALRRFLARDRSVRLTVDATFQARVAGILSARLRQAGHERGSVTVLRVETGELLASVSHPWPARPPISTGSARPEFLDRARYGLFPPGSTFKLVTAMAAQRRDPLAAEREFECQRLPGGRVGNSVRGWGRPIRDDPTVHQPHGSVAMLRGISASCNAYFAQLGTYVAGAQSLLETAYLLGIEVARPNTAAQLGDALPQASYGQGQVVATPLEMARVAATVANGARPPGVHWILGAPIRPAEALVPAEEARLLAQAMRAVVLRGTARSLGSVLPGIAGKTGTAQIEGAPSHAWFIGFAPYDAPAADQVAFSVIVENGGYGSQLPAAISADVAQAAAVSGLVPQE